MTNPPIPVPGWRLTSLPLLAAAAGACLPWLMPGLPSNPALLLIAAAVVVLAAMLPARARLVVLAALAGLLWTCWHAGSKLAQRLPPALEGVDLVAEGRIDELPRDDGDAVRFRYCPDRIWHEGRELEAAGCWRLSWFAPRRRGFVDPLAAAERLHLPRPEATRVQAGERWRLSVRLKRPRGLLNPGGFDAERTALEAGIAAVGYVRDNGERIGAASGLHALRAQLAERIDAAVGDPRMAALLRGLAVGDRRGFDDSDWRTLRRTGTSHLFAISGLHVGLVAMFAGTLALALTWCFPVLLRSAPRRFWALPPALLAATTYALLAGFQVPTRRALIMLCAAAIVLWLRRPVGLWQGWSLALCLVLLADPLAMLSVGFWLSFLGVAWLLLAAQGRGHQSYWKTATRAQWSVGLGLLPLGIGFFAQASWLAPVVNLVAIPWLAFVIVPILLLALPLLLVAPALADQALNGAAQLLSPLIAALDALADWSAAAAPIPEPSAIALACATVAVLLCLLPIESRQRWLVLPLLLPLLVHWPRLPEHGRFDLHVLDVGQGTAVLLRTQRHTLLFDTGAAFPNGYDLGQAVIVPALHALGVRRLDALVVSHADIDHAGGAASVLAEFPVARVLLGEPLPDIAGGSCRESELWRWDGVDLRLLHPPARYPTRGNELSCVLHVSGHTGSALLTGDAGEVAEMRMLNLHGEHLGSDVLILGHHGSRSSSSGPFLDAVRPKLAVATSGYRNRYQHPHAEVIERLRARDIAWLQLPDTGAVHLSFGDEGVHVRSRRQQRRRFWHEP